MSEVNPKGLKKLVQVISDMERLKFPIWHPATKLLHTRTRNALLEIANGLRMCNPSVITDSCFTHGSTVLDTPICRIHVRPGSVYSSLIITLPQSETSTPYKAVYQEEFQTFLKNPKEFTDQISRLINLRFVEYMTGRLN